VTVPTIEDYRRKIAGLLAKAEGTDNEHERETYREHAERLMIKMGIDAAELESRGEVKPEDIVEETRTWQTVYAPVMGEFAFAVGTAMGHMNFLQSRRGKDFVRTYVIGHRGDVAAYLTLLDSLHLQVWAAVREFRRDPQYRDTRQWNSIHENFVMDRSFVRSYGHAVAAKLRDMRCEEEAQASTGAALVLVGKAERVQAWQDERYPKVGRNRSRAQQSSSLGRSAGHRAGQRASLGGKEIGP